MQVLSSRRNKTLFDKSDNLLTMLKKSGKKGLQSKQYCTKRHRNLQAINRVAKDREIQLYFNSDDANLFKAFR